MITLGPADAQVIRLYLSEAYDDLQYRVSAIFNDPSLLKRTLFNSEMICFADANSKDMSELYAFLLPNSKSKAAILVSFRNNFRQLSQSINELRLMIDITTHSKLRIELSGEEIDCYENCVREAGFYEEATIDGKPKIVLY